MKPFSLKHSVGSHMYERNLYSGLRNASKKLGRVGEDFDSSHVSKCRNQRTARNFALALYCGTTTALRSKTLQGNTSWQCSDD